MELFVFLIKFLGFSQIAYDRCHLPGREKAVAGTVAFLFEFLQERKVVGIRWGCKDELVPTFYKCGYETADPDNT